MKLNFDEERWQRLQEELNVGQLCGENAGKLYAFAKGAMQRGVAGLVGEGDITPAEAAHCLDLLRKLRNNTEAAAHSFTTAQATIDDLIRQLEPAAPRSRRRA